MSTTRLTKQLRSEIADAIYKASKLPSPISNALTTFLLAGVEFKKVA